MAGNRNFPKKGFRYVKMRYRRKIENALVEIYQVYRLARNLNFVIS